MHSHAEPKRLLRKAILATSMIWVTVKSQQKVVYFWLELHQGDNSQGEVKPKQTNQYLNSQRCHSYSSSKMMVAFVRSVWGLIMEGPAGHLKCECLVEETMTAFNCIKPLKRRISSMQRMLQKSQRILCKQVTHEGWKRYTLPWWNSKVPVQSFFFHIFTFHHWLQWRSLTWLITKHSLDFQQGQRYVFLILISICWRDFADCCKILVKGILSVKGHLNI